MANSTHESGRILETLVREVTDLIEGGAIGNPGSPDDLRVAEILEATRKQIDRVIFT